MQQETQGSYAQINGLSMYYKIHGSGSPLVLLHGAFGTAEGWGTVLPTLAETHQVIVVELQGHGHTGDIDRPLSPQQLADDTAALLRQLGIQKADVFGYSMGGGVALALALQHPDLVRKLAVLGSAMGAMRDAYDPEVYKQFKSMTPENFHFPQVKDPYTRVAPDPSQWPVLVSKIVQMDDNFHGFDQQQMRSLQAPTLIMLGDRDGVRPEHAVEMYRLLPNAQLALFPNGDHFLLFSRPTTVLSTLVPFLTAPE
jgi:pimeloyl-ACP methyl ester carboxylesterase